MVFGGVAVDIFFVPLEVEKGAEESIAIQDGEAAPAGAAE